MKTLTYAEQRRLVKIWDTAGPELERLRREALRGKAYDPAEVDALLALGDGAPSRTTSGLIEMQRWFMKGHPRDTAPPARGGAPGGKTE